MSWHTLMVGSCHGRFLQVLRDWRCQFALAGFGGWCGLGPDVSPCVGRVPASRNTVIGS